MTDSLAEQAAGALDLPLFKVTGLLDRGTIEERQDHLRFKKAVAGKERGTAYFPDTGDVVRGFPKIRRTLVIDPAVPKHFDDEVVVEEKMNGYNVRIAQVDGDTVALTRGGVRCPYTEHWADRLVPRSFFDANPDLVICGEMVGPDNPYVTSTTYDVDSVQFFVFDLRHKSSNEPVPVDERQRLVEEHGLRGVEERLRTDPWDTDAIVDVVKALDEEEREGIVMKAPSMDREPVKYTTSHGNCGDLGYAFRYFQEYGADFIYPRAVREGFQAVEFDADPDERAKRLGHNILDALRETVEAKQEGERIVEQVQIRVHDPGVIEDFRNHLNRTGVGAIFHDPEELDDGSYRVRIDRLHQATNDKTRDLLDGGFW